MSYPELLLSNQLCFLFHRIDLKLNELYRPQLKELGITYPQYLVLLVLWEKPALTVGELCRRLSLDTGTVSPLVRRLAALGLVEKKRDEQDERVVTVKLTAQGKALEKRARAIPQKIGSCLLKDDREHAKLKAELQELLTRLGG